jgi:hypothetical protein
MRQVAKNVFLVLVSLLVVELLGSPAWSEQSMIAKPSPCSKDLNDPTSIQGPTVVFEWSEDNDVDCWLALIREMMSTATARR